MSNSCNLPDFITGQVGQLQIKTSLPKSSQITAVAVICHPHSLFGGTLDNKVVYQLARSFNTIGAVSVRFNFRGVGESEGAYDEGVGEQDDLLAVIEWAKTQWPETPLWVGGFSFGAYVALQSVRRIQPDWLVTVAPPVTRFPMTNIDPAIKHWLLIQGMQDEIVSADAVLEWAQSRSAKPVIEKVAGAGHFFHGKLLIIDEILQAANQSIRMEL